MGGKSHHSVIYFKLNINSSVKNESSTLKYQVDKGNYEEMREHMSKTVWEDVFKEAEEVDNWWDGFESTLNTAKEKFIPKKKFKQNYVKRSFSAPQTLLYKLQLKRKAFKQYKKFPTTSNYKIYAKYRNQVKLEVRKAKKAKEV